MSRMQNLLKCKYTETILFKIDCFTIITVLRVIFDKRKYEGEQKHKHTKKEIKKRMNYYRKWTNRGRNIIYGEDTQYRIDKVLSFCYFFSRRF